MKVNVKIIRKIFPGEITLQGLLDRTVIICSDDSGKEFKAAGAFLPFNRGEKVVLEGSFRKDTFEVGSYQEEPPRNKLWYLINCGLTTSEAVALINRHGKDVLEKLDANPDLIHSQNREARAIYTLRRPKNDLLQYLLQEIPKMRKSRQDPRPQLRKEKLPAILVKIPSLEDLLDHPYRWATVLPGFTLADARFIAEEQGVPFHTEEGAQAAILDILKCNEGIANGLRDDAPEATGNTCMRVQDLLSKAATRLEVLSDSDLVSDGLMALCQEGLVYVTDGYAYRACTAKAEFGIAEELARLTHVDIPQEDYQQDIDYISYKGGFRLAPEQINAVKVCLNASVSLLIGGPGTGKTTIERVILQIYKHFFPQDDVLLVAPTGKAACRMSESTGEPAVTVHRALGLIPGDDILVPKNKINAGLVLVDECSMLGSQETWALLQAIGTGARVIFVGDTNQLPSVGAGSVLFEMIQSGRLSIARLVTVYRQQAGSVIAMNCAKIKRGQCNLETGPAFIFKKAASQEEAQRIVLDTIQEELDTGLPMEQICVLSPFRRSTPTGTNELNRVIHERYKDETSSISLDGRKFCLHDRVMYMVNKGECVNGDMGTIISIDGDRFTVDFGDREVSFCRKDLRDFDYAYAITIHKSQGAEFKSCIILATMEHAAMLKRNLTYTAVSRAKEKVIIVGTEEALNLSIQTEEVTKRQSRLSVLIRKVCEKA